MTKEKVQAPQLPQIKKGESFECRITPEGQLTEGHWKNRGKLIPSGDGYKFTIERDERGFVFLKNLDYGWQKQNELKDERGKTYDVVEVNAQGHDFNNEPFASIDDAYEFAVKWLNDKEDNR